jgi:acyl-CoA dehydrogenase
VGPVVAGDVVVTAALDETARRWGGGLRTTAVRDGAGYVLEGRKTVVPALPVADLVIVPADLDGSPALFLVPTDTPGVDVERQHTTGESSTGHLVLAGVTLPGDAVLGDPGPDAVRRLTERAVVGVCAVQLGVLEQALAATAAYTTSRLQFDRPIATFQAVGHRLADAYIDVEAARLTLWQAAWRLSEGLEAATEVDVAKFWAAEAGHRVAHAAVHLHGGMGVARSHSLHRYFLAAKQHEFLLGSATDHLIGIGTALAEAR